MDTQDFALQSSDFKESLYEKHKGTSASATVVQYLSIDWGHAAKSAQQLHAKHAAEFAGEAGLCWSLRLFVSCNSMEFSHFSCVRLWKLHLSEQVSQLMPIDSIDLWCFPSFWRGLTWETWSLPWQGHTNGNIWFWSLEQVNGSVAAHQTKFLEQQTSM